MGARGGGNSRPGLVVGKLGSDLPIINYTSEILKQVSSQDVTILQVCACPSVYVCVPLFDVISMHISIHTCPTPDPQPISW